MGKIKTDSAADKKYWWRNADPEAILARVLFKAPHMEGKRDKFQETEVEVNFHDGKAAKEFLATLQSQRHCYHTESKMENGQTKISFTTDSPDVCKTVMHQLRHEYDFPQSELIRAEKELGFGQGREIG